MGNAATLQEVMNAVSRQLDAAAVAAPSLAGMSELDAFIALDPLLSDLHKQYIDARHTRLQAQKEYGPDDPMTEMAIDMEDSAWCAVQTRHMEIRSQRAKMAEAQKIMEEARVEEAAQAKKQKEKDALERYRQMEFFARMNDKNKFNGADIWLALVFLFNRDWFPFRYEQPTYSFNRCAA